MPVIPLAVPTRDGGVGADPVTYAHDRCLETAGKLPCGLPAATPEFQ